MFENELTHPELYGTLSRRGRQRKMREELRRREVVNSIGFANNLAGADTARDWSGNIWTDCPWDEVRSGVRDGVWFEDDFQDYTLPGTQTTQVAQGRYKAYCATAGQWAVDNMPHSTTAGVAGGIISGLCDTDGDAMSIGTEACPFLLTTTQQGKIWFEARIATTSILTNMGQLFCGLGENHVTTFSSTVPLGNADATSSAIAMIGFNRLEDGLGVLNTSYADHSATWTDVQAAANSTLAANTWIKLGMKINFKDLTRCVRFYVNNVECSSAITKAILLATTFMDVSGVGPLLAFYADSAGTADYVYIDRWRACQTFI